MAFYSLTNLKKLIKIYVTDGFGKKIDCKSLIVIATSNAGANVLYDKNSQIKNPNDLIQTLIENNYFSPEFLNRFDGVVAFNPITMESAFEIAKIIIDVVIKDIKQLHKIDLIVSDETIKNVINNNFNPAYGARNLDHALRVNIEDIVAKKVLEGSVKSGETLTL